MKIDNHKLNILEERYNEASNEQSYKWLIVDADNYIRTKDVSTGNISEKSWGDLTSLEEDILRMEEEKARFQDMEKMEEKNNEKNPFAKKLETGNYKEKDLGR